MIVITTVTVSIAVNAIIVVAVLGVVNSSIAVKVVIVQVVIDNCCYRRIAKIIKLFIFIIITRIFDKIIFVIAVIDN